MHPRKVAKHRRSFGDLKISDLFAVDSPIPGTRKTTTRYYIAIRKTNATLCRAVELDCQTRRAIIGGGAAEASVLLELEANDVIRILAQAP
ncbi:MAG: hypothetical protein ABIG71_02955 [Candidatus Uhrbacteria bacterium]